jgi:Holliday junction resolvase
MVHSYRKGYAKELQLTHTLAKRGYMAVRMPRSGRMPDIIALKNGKILAIECKAREAAFKIEAEQLAELKQWQAAGAEAYIAWKLARKEWVFLRLEDVEQRNGNVGKGFAAEKGLGIEKVAN